MAKKVATALVLGLMAALLVGATPANAASNLTPRQAVAACKAERKADPAGFKVKYGLGSKKRGAFLHCVASKVAPQIDQIIGQLPSAGLPALPGLPTTLPPSACQALNAALTQLPGLNLNQLIGQIGSFQLPSGIPPQFQQQLAQLQSMLTQLQSLLSANLGFLQGLIQGQLNALTTQLQAQLAILCPPA